MPRFREQRDKKTTPHKNKLNTLLAGSKVGYALHLVSSPCKDYHNKLSTYLGALQQLVLASGDVLLLAGPSAQHGCLQGTAVGEGEGPWPQEIHLIDGVQVHGGLLLRLSAGQEGDSGNGRGHGAAQSGDGSDGHLLGGELLGAALASGDHVGLQQGSLQVDVVVVQRLVDGGQDGLGDLLGAVQVMVTIGQHLGLNDGHDALRLADGGVTGQHVGVLQDRLVAGGVLADLQHATPLGKVAAVLLVLGATRSQVIETCVWGRGGETRNRLELDMTLTEVKRRQLSIRLLSILYRVKRNQEPCHGHCHLPWVVHSPSEPIRSTTPLSTLIPGMMFFFFSSSTKGVPSSAFW